jgi:hypothetical protein
MECMFQEGVITIQPVYSHACLHALWWDKWEHTNCVWMWVGLVVMKRIVGRTWSSFMGAQQLVVGSRDNVVGIMTSYRLDDRGVRIRVPVG